MPPQERRLARSGSADGQTTSCSATAGRPLRTSTFPNDLCTSSRISAAPFPEALIPPVACRRRRSRSTSLDEPSLGMVITM